MFKNIAGLAALVALIVTPHIAVAQTSNSQLSSNSVKEKFSASDFVALVGEFQFAAVMAPYEGNLIANVVAQNTDGATFIITLGDCDNAAAGTGCAVSAIYTGFSNAGVSYEDINNFHDISMVSKAVNSSADNLVIVGVQQFFQGGVTREYVLATIARFLLDAASFSEALEARGTTVAMKISPEGGAAKIENHGASAQTNAVVHELFDTDHALKAAISNTRHIRFLLEDESQ